MARECLDDGEDQWASAPVPARSDDSAEAFSGTGRIAVAWSTLGRECLPQAIGNSHRIAAKAQGHRRDERYIEGREPQIGGDRQGRQHVGNIEMPDRNAVANICP